MADGLLSNAMQALKNQYQETKGNVGLLMSDPKRYMSGLNQDAAEYNRLSSLALQAERNAYRGLPVSAEQVAAKQYIDQQQQDMALAFAAPIVYHGTPHSFNKFDIAKVGTGEGNQAFGHGMYFAENKDIAKSYMPNFYERLAESRMFGSKDIDDAIRKAREELDYVLRNKAPASTVNEVRQEISMLELKKSGSGNTGSLYKVDLPNRKVAKMVDYDEPIKNQNKTVRDFAIKQGLLLDDTGFDLIQKVGRDKAGSDAMRAAGIPGIKYTDQMNRVGGKETKNYVVFDPSRLKILEKN
jgi:hypothetical protein